MSSHQGVHTQALCPDDRVVNMDRHVSNVLKTTMGFRHKKAEHIPSGMHHEARQHVRTGDPQQQDRVLPAGPRLENVQVTCTSSRWSTVDSMPELVGASAVRQNDDHVVPKRSWIAAGRGCCARQCRIPIQDGSATHMDEGGAALSWKAADRMRSNGPSR